MKTITPKCTSCGEDDKSKFYKKSRTKVRSDGSVYKWIGFYAKCKSCTNKINTRNRSKYKVYYKEYRELHRAETSKRSKMWSYRQKSLWIKILSSRLKLECSLCGYNKSFSALDFHHEDPQEKDRNIHFNQAFKTAPTQERVDRVLGELKKCIILCSNCHREHHSVYFFHI